MRFAVLVAAGLAACGSAAPPLAFDRFLLQEATMKDIKACHMGCGTNSTCHRACPKGVWGRVKEQCGTLDASMACHRACGHDLVCHFKCPMAKPTSLAELKELSDHMVCHAKCRGDKSCHRKCGNPWAWKQAQCEELAAVAECHKSCGKDHGCHVRCPTVDLREAEEAPFSLLQDIADHVVDHLLPPPQEATMEEIKRCHTGCGEDFACHKKCPSGVWGRLQGQCEILGEMMACHKGCGRCYKCHMACPMAKPASVRELKEFVDAMMCHPQCGKNQACHKACVDPWEQKKGQCVELKTVKACHQGCGKDRACHKECPRLEKETMEQLAREPTSLTKDIIDHAIQAKDIVDSAQFV